MPFRTLNKVLRHTYAWVRTRTLAREAAAAAAAAGGVVYGRVLIVAEVDYYLLAMA